VNAGEVQVHGWPANGDMMTAPPTEAELAAANSLVAAGVLVPANLLTELAGAMSTPVPNPMRLLIREWAERDRMAAIGPVHGPHVDAIGPVQGPPRPRHRRVEARTPAGRRPGTYRRVPHGEGVVLSDWRWLRGFERFEPASWLNYRPLTAADMNAAPREGMGWLRALTAPTF